MVWGKTFDGEGGGGQASAVMIMPVPHLLNSPAQQYVLMSHGVRGHVDKVLFFLPHKTAEMPTGVR